MKQEGFARHIPVLHSVERDKSLVLNILKPAPGESVLDVTLGLGGHSEAFLEAVGPVGKLTALDADPDNIQDAKMRLKDHRGHSTYIHGNFRNVRLLVSGAYDVVFADLGLSSPHLDDPAKGFSFRVRAPLDMRFDRTSGRQAWQMLARMDEREITLLLRRFGDVQRAGALARDIFQALTEMREGDIWSTDDLKACVERIYGYKAPQVLPQVFQAVRIGVNDELGALESLLAAVPTLLRPGGRCGIISYHSLEDRLVKHCFRALTTPLKDPHTGGIAKEADFVLLTKKAVVPSSKEQQDNPRSRSAKFRVIQRRPIVSVSS